MPSSSVRVVAVDWLRGLVMVLMAIDHVDHAVNPHHVQRDGAMFGGREALSAPDFAVRWVTHLCAPTFVLLAGVSIALSAANAAARGAPGRDIDRHLVLRGLVIVALELTLVSWFWRTAEGAPGSLLPVFPLVLWAIGGCIVLAPMLRRLPDAALLGLAAALAIGLEFARTATLADAWSQPLANVLFVTGGIWPAVDESAPVGPDVICTYPLLAWLPVFALGIVLGRRLAAGALSTRLLTTVGLAGLLLFAVLRGLDGFGNMGLHRRDGSVIEWLHCSKYPPSLTFLGLELGISLLLLALLTRLESTLARLPRHTPLATLGRVPLFYYLLHLEMIGLFVFLGPLPDRSSGTWVDSLWGTLLVVLACWPCCIAYDWYKRRFRHAWARFL